MISHKHKCIFIHIPKCAGTSIFKFFHPNVKINWAIPNYEVLYGWCPQRKIHLQHATSKQLIETNLVTEEQWNEYYKFTIVRNPWDRAYSDYLWICKERKIKDSFKNYISKEGKFSRIFNDPNIIEYRGDHLLRQIDFFDLKGDLKLNRVMRFESLNADMDILINELNIKEKFNSRENVSSKRKNKHYSRFYSLRNKQRVEEYYNDDIKVLGYAYEDKSNFIHRLFKL